MYFYTTEYFSSGCTRLFFVGVGVGVGVVGWGWWLWDKNIKNQKWLIFVIFVLLREICGGRASDWERVKCPMPPMSPLPFFSEKHQTLHDLSLANCMHGNEMISVDS